MNRQDFLAYSDQAKLCIALALQVSVRVKSGDSEDAAAKRRLLQQAYDVARSPERPDPRPYFQRLAEITPFSEVDIGWPYKWRTAHEAALGIAAHVLISDADETTYLLSADAFGSLARRLNDEKVKLLASLTVASLPPIPNSVMLTGDEFAVLRELCDNAPRRVTLTELAKISRVGRKTIGETILPSLVSNGLVSYVASKRIGAAATPAGMQLIGAANPAS